MVMSIRVFCVSLCSQMQVILPRQKPILLVQQLMVYSFICCVICLCFCSEFPPLRVIQERKISKSFDEKCLALYLLNLGQLASSHGFFLCRLSLSPTRLYFFTYRTVRTMPGLKFVPKIDDDIDASSNLTLPGLNENCSNRNHSSGIDEYSKLAT